MRRFKLSISCFFLLLMACEREVELPALEIDYAFQPFNIGDTWTYAVEETIYFGENDSEDASYYLQDRMRTLYVNDAKEQVFVVARYRSNDLNNWVFQSEFTLLIRERSLIRTLNNQPEVVLIFPIIDGKTWDGNRYRNAPVDEYMLEILSPSEVDGQVKIWQEDSDDEITFRDIRYDIFQKGVGLVEKYSEVLTYCSRNDCLGEQLIDSGSKIHMELVSYEQ